MRRVLAWLPLALGVVVATATIVIEVIGERLGNAGLAVGLLLLVATGGLIAARRPANPVGWLLSFYFLNFQLTIFTETYASQQYLGGRVLPGADVAGWLAAWNWAVGLAALALALLHFPTGRLPSRWWRPARWAAVASAVLLAAVAVQLWPLRDASLVLELHTGLPVGMDSRLADVAVALMELSLAAGAASLLVRYWRAGHEERLQLKWLVPPLIVLVGGIAVFSVAGRGPTVTGAGTLVGEIATLIGLAGLVVAMAVAIFKYRLYTIDRVISRTLAYALVTGVLVAVYALSVVALQALLRPLAADSDLAVAGSTLAVAALFGPVRRRVQAGVDRRFNRRRYDAARAVASFGQRLRDEVNLDEVAAELRRTATGTLQPATVGVWLRDTPS